MPILGATKKLSTDFWWLISVGAGVLIALALLPESGDTQHKDVVANSLAAVGATLLGFVLTAVTILAALSKTRLLSNMYRTGHAKNLLNELFGAVILFLLQTVFSMVSLLVPPGPDRIVDLAWIYFALGIAVMISGGIKFYNVMIALGRPSPDRCKRPGKAPF